MTIEVEDLKKRLGLDGQYPAYCDFYKRVLKPSIEQIKINTDIQIELGTVKKNRKISTLRFDMKFKTPRPIKLSNQKTNLELKKISSTLEVKSTPGNPKQQSVPSFILNN